MDTPVDGLCASELIGSIVRSHAQDEEVGSINDLIFNRERSLLAIVIDVGWDQVRLIWKLNDGEFAIHIDVSEDMLEPSPGSRNMNGRLPDKMST